EVAGEGGEVRVGVVAVARLRFDAGHRGRLRGSFAAAALETAAPLRGQVGGAERDGRERGEEGDAHGGHHRSTYCWVAGTCLPASQTERSSLVGSSGSPENTSRLAFLPAFSEPTSPSMPRTRAG